MPRISGSQHMPMLSIGPADVISCWKHTANIEEDFNARRIFALIENAARDAIVVAKHYRL